MQRIAELLLRYKEYATALVLIIVSLVLISDSSSQKLRSFRTISVGIIASVQSSLNWLPNPFALETENHALRQLSKDLSIQAMELRDAAVRVEKLKRMLEFKQTSQMKLLTASVVGKTTIQLRNFATLNVGEKDGVREGMPVINEHGLIGRIIGLSDNYSIVQLLINRDTRIAAKTLSGRNDGLITWDGGSSLLMRNMPAVQHQQKGDTVITSNYSSLYPDNIVIGTIKQMEEEQGTLFYKINVEPAVDFATLEEAFVVLHFADQERLDLERSVLEQQTPEETRRSTQ